MTVFAAGFIQSENSFHSRASLSDAAEDFFLKKGFGGFGSNDELEEAGMVAEIDKNKSTMVAAGIDPASNGDSFA